MSNDNILSTQRKSWEAKTFIRGYEQIYVLFCIPIYSFVVFVYISDINPQSVKSNVDKKDILSF